MTPISFYRNGIVLLIHNYVGRRVHLSSNASRLINKTLLSIPFSGGKTKEKIKRVKNLMHLVDQKKHRCGFIFFLKENHNPFNP